MGRTPTWLRDAWLPAVLAGAAVTEAAGSYAARGLDRTALLSVLLPMTLVTAGRRRSPVQVSLAVSVLITVLTLAVLPDVATQPPLTAFLVLLATLFNLGVHGSGRWFVPGTVAVGSCLGALQLVALTAGQPPGDVAPSVLFLGGAFALGRVVGVTRREAESERKRAALAEATRAEHATAAAAAERARIARELHDVIAHALTGIVVQASVEARLQTDAGSTSHHTLQLIEQRGREAMTELRRLLGLLREEGQGPAAAPLPSLVDCASLAHDLERAGHQVALETSGDLDDLPPSVDLAGYRVLQEGLTNAARHAPGSDVSVHVGLDHASLRVRVVNGAPSGPATEIGSGGAGLAGMRERVRVFGGRLTAGPLDDGGFEIDALLPVTPPSGTLT